MLCPLARVTAPKGSTCIAAPKPRATTAAMPVITDFFAWILSSSASANTMAPNKPAKIKVVLRGTGCMSDQEQGKVTQGDRKGVSQTRHGLLSGVLGGAYQKPHPMLSQ